MANQVIKIHGDVVAVSSAGERRTLTVGESIDRGIGPICAETFGF